MDTKDRKNAVCAHCGLPVGSACVPSDRECASSDEPLFCCFGCRMVWEMEQHHRNEMETGDHQGSDHFSPLNLLYLRFSLALIASIFLIFISLTLHFEAGSTPAFLQYVSFALATAVILLLAAPFLENLKHEITERRLSLASLIFVGSSAAYVLSTWNTLAGTGLFSIAGWEWAVTGSSKATYFETSAMILTFYVGSLLIDTRIKKELSGYSRLWEPGSLPEVLKVVNDSAAAGNNHSLDTTRTMRCDPADLKAGDRCLCESGQPILFDAEVEKGSGLVDESHLTGEPDAVRKQEGDSVTAGSISIDGGMILKLIKPYEESTLSYYMERARAMRSRPGYYERIASRGASVLLAVVMLAAFGGLGWYLVTATTAKALEVFLAVLLIGCPCAFAISIPSALWVAHQRLHRTGIVAMGGSSALEQLSGTKLVMFDKTGTLTEGIALKTIHRVTDDPDWPSDRLLQLAGGIEMDQTHPFARALRRYLAQHDLSPLPVGSSEVLPGQGVRATWSKNGANSHNVLLVNNRYQNVKKQLSDEEFGLFLDGRLMARFSVYQPPREHLEQVVRKLRYENRVRVVVVTGDPVPAEQALPESVLNEVDYHAACSPEDKAILVDRYRKKYGNVLFVGDGTNDLMAINRADLGVGVYTGTLSIRNNADFVLFHPNLVSISEMLHFSRSIRRTIRGNFFWAVIYNFIGIGIALMGLLHPFFAILAMMLSSLLVTLHALTLRRRRPSLGRLERDVNRHVESELLQAGMSGA